MPKKVDMPSDEKAQIIMDVVEDRKAVDPVLIDLRGKTLLTDFFIVCTGTSNVHIRAIAERVLERGEDERLPKPRVEGEQVGEWVLIDFGDVVLHVMGEEPRERYKLEQFWTTPQPKGALPPTPESIAEGAGDELEDVADLDFGDEEGNSLDEDELEDAAFFEDADTEVEPIDEDDVDEESPRSSDK